MDTGNQGKGAAWAWKQSFPLSSAYLYQMPYSVYICGAIVVVSELAVHVRNPIKYHMQKRPLASSCDNISVF